MPSETLTTTRPVPPRSAPDHPSRLPQTQADQEADVLRGFVHIVLNFAAQARSFLAPHVNVTDPTSVPCFVSKLASHPISDDVGELLSGRFRDIVNFATLFMRAPLLNTQSAPTAPDRRHPPATTPQPPHSRSFLEVVKQNAPVPPPRPHAQLPRLIPGQPSPPTTVQPDTYRLSRRCTSSLQRAAIAVCGYEEKRYVTITTAPNAPPIRHPSNLRHVFREGQAPGSHVIFPTHNPRTLLVCGPKSSLPLLQTAYDRARDFRRARGCMLLPEAKISSFCDPVSLPQTPADQVNLLQAFRDEIARHGSPANEWRARRFYANALADTEAKLYDLINEGDMDWDLDPLERSTLVRQRTNTAPVPAHSSPTHEMHDDDEDDENPPAKLLRHN